MGRQSREPAGSWLNTFEQVFGEPAGHSKTKELPIRELHEFDGHPFRVVDDESMEELVQSIRDRGILVPVMVRPGRTDGYEIISGHRRCHAAFLAGLFKVPAVICELTDEEAVDAMIYTNIQRASILPSEKARAYRLQMEIMKHPGARGSAASTAAGRKYGDNARKVQRYIRLTFLIDDLLALVDEGKLCMQAGYELSFMKQEQQRWVMQVYRETKRLPSGNLAEKIRSCADDEDLSPEKICAMVSGKGQERKNIVLSRKRIEPYLTKDISDGEITELAYSLFREWRTRKEAEKNNDS